MAACWSVISEASSQTGQALACLDRAFDAFPPACGSGLRKRSLHSTLLQLHYNPLMQAAIQDDLPLPWLSELYPVIWGAFEVAQLGCELALGRVKGRVQCDRAVTMGWMMFVGLLCVISCAAVSETDVGQRAAQSCLFPLMSTSVTQCFWVLTLCHWYLCIHVPQQKAGIHGFTEPSSPIDLLLFLVVFIYLLKF